MCQASVTRRPSGVLALFQIDRNTPMNTEKTVSNLRADLDRYADAIRHARTLLRGADLLAPVVSSAAQELRRVAGALMSSATELQQAQRVAAVEARAELAG